MATEKIFNTRIINKHDVYEKWQSSSLILKDGEVVICTIPADTGVVQGEPVVMFKVGDGNNVFKDLPWTAARAADVYSWAKAPEKPTYSASEITGIANYIAEYVESEMGISVDTDTQYQVVKVDDYNYKLQSKGKGDAAWGDVAGSAIVIPNDTAAIAALQNLVGNQSIADQIATAIAALDLENTYDAKGSAAQALTDAKAYADGKDAAIKAAQDAADAAQGATDALTSKVGAVPEGSTVMGIISDIQENAYDDTEVRNLIQGNADAIATEKERAEGVENGLETRLKAVEDDYLKAADKTELQNAIDAENARINTLVGEDTGKSARTIAVEELTKQLVTEDAQESLDTLAEIAQWIQDHPDDAAAMNTAIAALQAKVDTGNKNVSTYVADAISALKIGDYALAADLTALAGRVSALEGTSHEHGNKALLDTYTQTEANLADAVAKKHEHANADELAKIVSGDKAKWDAAEQNAKTYADGLNAAMDTRVTDAEDAIDGLHAIAGTGNVNDLVQTTGDILVLNCGDSSV